MDLIQFVEANKIMKASALMSYIKQSKESTLKRLLSKFARRGQFY